MDIYNDHRNLQNRFFDFYKLDKSTKPDNTYMGAITPFNATEFVIDFFNWWVYIIDEKLDKLKEWSEEYALLFNQRGFSLDEFKLVLSGRTKEENFEHERIFDYLYITDKHAQDVFISKFSNSENDLTRAYLESIKENITFQISLLYEFFFIKKLHIYLPSESLERHTHILAKSGSGKSELIKLMFYDLQKKSAYKRNKTLIAIAPEADLPTELLRFRLNKGKDMKRIIFLDLNIRQTIKNLTGEDFLKEDYNFCINPFEVKDISRDNIGFFRDHLNSAFFEIIRDTEASKIMSDVIRACIDTLLQRKGSTIDDLVDFMDDEKNEDLIKLGLENPNKVVGRMVKRLRDDKDVSRTKKGVFSRLLGLTLDETFSTHIVGVSTINIEKEINSGKVIICNFSKGKMGADVINSFGKLIVATIQGAVMRREDTPKENRIPTFMFIDEFQNYVNPSIRVLMAEARKYALSAILSHQIAGQDMTKKLSDIISGNTALKIGGESDSPTRGALVKELKGITNKDFEELNKYSFFVYDSNNKESGTRTLDIPDYLVNPMSDFYMDKEALKKYFSWLVYESGYYTKTIIEDDSSPKTSKVSSDSNSKTIYKPNFED